MTEYRGNKQAYKLGKKIGAGGEGTVYKIENAPGLAAKIFHDSCKDQDKRRRKIETMIAYPIRPVVEGILRMAWPQDVLYDGSDFVGYVMPYVKAPYEIFYVYREDAEREKILPGYTWKYSVQYAYNLSWVVWYIHMNQIVIGDMNMKNIRISDKGEVVLIDCDSFDIRDPRTGEHFMCEVGLPEMLAPELQTVGRLCDGDFSKESDDFSLAIHIFRLLMKNSDPFGAKLISKRKSSKSEADANAAIINGECVYVRDVPGKAAPDWVPPFEMLPEEIRSAFGKTFNYNAVTAMKQRKNRTTAEEWTRILLKYAQKSPNANLSVCRKNKRHIYPSHNTFCPWCGASTFHDSRLMSTVRSIMGY